MEGLDDQPLETGEDDPPDTEETPPEPKPEAGALAPELQRALTWF